jgi:hypothetical protein
MGVSDEAAVETSGECGFVVGDDEGDDLGGIDDTPEMASDLCGGQDGGVREWRVSPGGSPATGAPYSSRTSLPATRHARSHGRGRDHVTSNAATFEQAPNRCTTIP